MFASIPGFFTFAPPTLSWEQEVYKYKLVHYEDSVTGGEVDTGNTIEHLQ